MVSPDRPDEGLHRWHDVLAGQVAAGALLLAAVLQWAVSCGWWQRLRAAETPVPPKRLHAPA